MGDIAKLPVDENGEVKTDIKNFLAHLGKNYDYIAIGDTEHSKRIFDYFDSDEFLQGLKAGGVGIVARERQQDPVIQNKYNNMPSDFFKDDEKRERFIETEKSKTSMQPSMHDWAAAIRKNDMQVAFVDMSWADWATNALKKGGVSDERAERAGKMANETITQFSRFMRAIKSDKPLANTWNLIWNDKEFEKAFWNAILSPIDSLTVLWHADTIAKYRVREVNVEMAENIKAVKGKEPMAVILGATHIRRARGVDENSNGKIDVVEEMDVDEMLGKNTVHIEIYPEEYPKQSYVGKAFSSVVNTVGCYVGDINQIDVPHYKIYLDGNGGKGKIIRLPRTSEPEASLQTEVEKPVEQTNKSKTNDVSMTDIGQLNAQTFPMALRSDQSLQPAII